MKPDPKPKKTRKMKPLTDKKLLELWGKAVKERAGHKCEYPECNVKYTQLHPHHFYSRRIVPMRYNIDAGICLCATHHTLGSHSAHLDPDFKDIIIARGVRTEEWLKDLVRQKNVITKNTAEFKLECYKKLAMYL